MHRVMLRSAIALSAFAITACVPPREHLDGRSADGLTRVAVELRPAGGDSVRGSGTLELAGRPRVVELAGRWNDAGDGIRSLEATLRSDTTPDERWALEWSPSTLNGSLRGGGAADAPMAVPLTMP